MRAKLVWVRCPGWKGSTLMLVVSENDTYIWGFRWKAHASRWTRRVREEVALVIGRVPPWDEWSPRIRSALDAAKDQLPKIVLEN